MTDAAEDPSIEQLLNFGRSVGGLSKEEREALLTQLLKLPEEERRSPLELLLLQWAESDPGAPVLWCRELLKGREQDALIDGIRETWAHQDPFGCIDWWVANTSEKGLYNGDMIDVMVRTDLVAYAYFMDRPEMHFTGGWGAIYPEVMPGTKRLPELAAAVVGNVGYKTDLPEDLSIYPLRRCERGKSGWNELFEKVAVAWHAESPKECEAWLKGFPEEAQTAARSRIENPQ